MTLANSMTLEELSRLRAFRNAAAQVRSASIVDQAATVGFGAGTNPDGTWVQTIRILSEEPFRSLAMSIRLVYMQGEPAHFGPLCGLLLRNVGSPIGDEIHTIRGRYESTLDTPWVQFALHGAFEGRTVGPREIFDIWLYYGAFHQDLSKKEIYEELARFGPRFQWGVHAIALQLTGCVLDLDDIIADLLNEPRVPRITAPVQA